MSRTRGRSYRHATPIVSAGRKERLADIVINDGLIVAISSCLLKKKAGLVRNPDDGPGVNWPGEQPATSIEEFRANKCGMRQFCSAFHRITPRRIAACCLLLAAGCWQEAADGSRCL